METTANDERMSFVVCRDDFKDRYRWFGQLCGGN